MSNVFKTGLLMAALTAIIVLIGDYLGGPSGMITALLFAGILNFGMYWFSDKIVLAMYHAQEVSPAEAPELHALVEKLARQAGLPKPRVYIIPMQQPNAFATGRNPENAAVAVTEGIMKILTLDELEGVLAHELAHVRSRDVLIATIAATLAGAITMIANMIRYAAFFGGFRSDKEGEDSGSMLGALALAVVAPIAALIIQMAISRSREYLADETGAKISGRPLSLARALAKLERAAQAIPADANPASAHMFIVNPLSAEGIFTLFSTHPPIQERIARLERLASTTTGGVW
ncbi:MAG: zinc metalloprotease HtpX [Armatimonadota bacterium]